VDAYLLKLKLRALLSPPGVGGVSPGTVRWPATGCISRGSAANGQAKGCLAANLVNACGLSDLIK
jgi:hypothetical protein